MPEALLLNSTEVVLWLAMEDVLEEATAAKVVALDEDDGVIGAESIVARPSAEIVEAVASRVKEAATELEEATALEAET